MRDRDIRKALWAHLRECHQGDGSLILDELRLCQGSARVDVAVVNGSLGGYEIKSEHDTLRRLPGQLETYTSVFDHLTVVAGPRYAESLAAILPGWAGLLIAKPNAEGVIVFELAVPPSANPYSSAAAQAELLWRDEALDMLSSRGLDRGLRSAPKRKLWSALAEFVPAEDLKQLVRETVRARGDWRVDRRRVLGGVTS